MFAVSCPSCPHLIVLTSPTDRPPPWCPRCGSDLKPRVALNPPSPELVAAATKKWNERGEATAAVATAPALADSLQDAMPPVTVPAEPRPVPALHDEARPLPESPAAKGPVPAWASLFALACGVIPLLTLGGALPTMIGVGGASSCLKVARNKNVDSTARVCLCAGITVACWAALFVLLHGLMLFSW